MKMKRRTYYQLLEVESNASPEDIKKAYIRLARQFHPDRNRDDPDAARRFAEIAEAYQTISRIESRYAYDLELGIEPAGEATVPSYQRLEETPVTGSEVGDYIEELVGGLQVPLMARIRAQEYEVRGFDNRAVERAYKDGLFSLEHLEHSDMHSFYREGIELLKQKEFEGALAYLQQAVDINPRNLEYRFALGCAFDAKGDLKAAQSEYEEALALGKKKRYPCQPIREALISIYLRTGSYERCKQQCREVWDLGLTSSLAEEALVKIRYEEKREEEGPGGD